VIFGLERSDTISAAHGYNHLDGGDGDDFIYGG
jgi:hypothetical protein